MMVYFLAFLCVIIIAIGQVLFKISATEIGEAGVAFSKKPIIYFFCAIALYGIASVAWVFILKNIDLGKIYPIMAFSFIIVPVLSFLIFNEVFGPQYIFGSVLIVIGVSFCLHA